MARKNGELVIHRYPDLPCELPHETWSGDYAFVRTLQRLERQVFMNTHTPEYLRLFCEHTPVMQEYLETAEYTRGVLTRAQFAIARHYRLQWEEEEGK